MLRVRHFTTGLTHKALDYLDKEIAEWICDEKLEVKEIRECYGQTPTGMSGALEHSIILSVWYECKEEPEKPKAA